MEYHRNSRGEEGGCGPNERGKKVSANGHDNGKVLTESESDVQSAYPFGAYLVISGKIERQVIACGRETQTG